MPMGRFELPSPKAHASEACVFTNFTTSAFRLLLLLLLLCYLVLVLTKFSQTKQNIFILFSLMRICLTSYL